MNRVSATSQSKAAIGSVMAAMIGDEDSVSFSIFCFGVALVIVRPQ